MSETTDAQELTAFVSGTLKAIAQGIEEAQGSKISSAHRTGEFGFSAPEQVEFDVAVSAKSTGSGGGGMKVAVFGIGANMGAEVGSENSTISRIRFSVPTKFKDTTTPKQLDTTKLRKGVV